MLRPSLVKLGLDELVGGLKAAGEPTRLRILALLVDSELTVKDLTVILGQSQPRVSRHLKLMVEAGLIERHPEGAWVYYRASDQGGTGQIVKHLNALVDGNDVVRQRDVHRLRQLKHDLSVRAQGYFASNAREWDKIRSLHVAEEAVEQAMLDMTGDLSVDTFIDLGTGTGRMLELFADRYERAVGLDMNAEMLTVARARLSELNITSAQIRRGDINAVELHNGSAELVTVHQVLHFLTDPAGAVREAARLLAPGGHVLIVDFAPHDIETLRTEHAHRRLGFPVDQVNDWLLSAGLEIVEVRDLIDPERPDEDLLGVTLWFARKPDTPIITEQT